METFTTGVLRIQFILLVVLAFVLGWQRYFVDWDWDSGSFVIAVREGCWFVDLGYGRIGYLFLMRPARWVSALLPGGATFDSIYAVMKAIHLGFSVLLIWFWYQCACRLFDKRTALLGAPLLLLNILFLTYTSRIWTEMPMLMGLYGSLWIWTVLVWKGEDRRRRVVGWALVGGILALCVMVREIAMFFLPVFVAPLLVSRDRRREGLLAAAGLVAVVALVFLFCFLLRRLSPPYDRAVSIIEAVSPWAFSPAAIVVRVRGIARVLVYYSLIPTVLCLISFVILAGRREWPMVMLLVCLTFAPLSWIMLQGGPFHARYVMPSAPGLALACLPLFRLLETRRTRIRQVLLAVTLLGGLAITADWGEVRNLERRARSTRRYTRRWVELASREMKPAVWLVGSFSEVLHGQFTDGPLDRHNKLYWPLWLGEYKQILPAIEGDLQEGKTIYVHTGSDAYFGNQFEFIQTLRREFLLEPVDRKSDLFQLKARPLPETTVVADFSSESFPEVLVKGFDHMEQWGNGTRAVWANRKEAVLRFPSDRLPRPREEDKGILVRLRWFCLDRPGSPSVDGSMNVEYGDNVIRQDFAFPPGENYVSFVVPRQKDPDAILRLSFNFSALWVPAEAFAESGDRRTLAAALVGVTMIPLSEPTSPDLSP